MISQKKIFENLEDLLNSSLQKYTDLEIDFGPLRCIKAISSYQNLQQSFQFNNLPKEYNFNHSKNQANAKVDHFINNLKINIINIYKQPILPQADNKNVKPTAAFQIVDQLQSS
ncbi:hypothetical protein ABPG73_008965 [Tetrahymena malaccensis]